MPKHWLRTFALLFALMLPLSACQSKSEPNAEPPVTTVTESESPATPESPFKSYLTGLPVDEMTANRRPIAIMINNIRQALPQYGISKAGIIYEALAEGGITRLLAVFDDYATLDVIGSVRSSRPYYLDMAQGLDAVYFHIGASPAAYAAIKSRKMDSFDLISGRDKSRIKNNGLEHSLMTSGAKIAVKLEATHKRLLRNAAYPSAFQFSDDVKFTGETANKVTVPFSNYKTGVFTYDSETDQYLVSQYGKAHMDAGADCQLSMKNVFVLRINSYVVKGDTHGRLAHDIVGSGKGYYITGGKMVPIKWEKDSPSKSFYYTTENGAELTVARGDSYVCIVPLRSAVKFE